MCCVNVVNELIIYIIVNEISAIKSDSAIKEYLTLNNYNYTYL